MSKLRSVGIVLLTVLVQGCVSAAHLPQELRDQIPKEANAIQVYSEESPTAYYDKIYRHFASQGFVISQENREMGTLATEFKDIGQGTTLKVNVFVEHHEGFTVATFRGQWGVTTTMAAGLSAGLGTNLGGSTADSAAWDKTGRPKVAFGELALLVNKIEHIKLEYVKL